MTVVAATAIAAAVGSAVALIDWRVPLVLIVAASVAVSIVRRPALGALCLLMLVTLLPRDLLFEHGIAFGGGALKPTDLIVAAALGTWLVRMLLSPATSPLPSKSTTLLLLGILALSALAVVIAYGAGTSPKLSLLELRPLLSYMLVFPIVGDVKSFRELTRGVYVVLGCAGIASTIAIVYYILGIGDAATYADGAVRVTSVPLLGPLIAVVFSLSLLAFAKTSRAQLLLVLLAGAGLGGLFVTFQRGAWVAAIGALFLALIFATRQARARLLLRGSVVLSLAAAAILIVNAFSVQGVSDPLQSGQARLISIARFEQDESAQHRFNEWAEAKRQIETHPLTGIGLGSSITFYSPMFSQELNTYGSSFTTYYIHNSYVWLPLKLGLMGALFVVLLIGFTLVSGIRKLTEPLPDQVRPILLGCCVALSAIAILSLSGPHLNTDNATPYVAALIGAIELCRRFALVSIESTT